MRSPESPKPEAPIALRSDRELKVLPVQKSPPAASAAGPAAAEAFSAATLTLAGLAMGGGIGWVVQRRARLARRGASPAAAEPEREPTLAQEPPPESTLAPGLQPRAWRGWVLPRSLRSRKRQVKILLRVRRGAGLVAILAAVAVLVFWSIEEIDGATKEPGLYLALLGLALATGAGAWWCGRLADRLHRALYD